MIEESIRDQILKAASRARLKAHAPYSKFRVGAAVSVESGRIFTGCNIENASYGLTVCAERVAVFKAISEGQILITALALSIKGGGSPCGACRQVIHEFAPGIPIYIGDTDGNLVSETSMPRLLPDAFGPDNL